MDLFEFYIRGLKIVILANFNLLCLIALVYEKIKDALLFYEYFCLITLVIGSIMK